MVKGVATSIITVAVLMGSLVACGESGNDNKSDSAEMEEQIESPQKIVLTRLKESDNRWMIVEIYVMDVDSYNVRRLTNGYWDTSPHWSPDGSQIVFDSDRDNDIPDDDYPETYAEIYVMDANGKNVRQLTNTDEIYNLYPQWSPDGSQIVFSSDRDGAPEIFVMDADGKNVRQLTSSGLYSYNPSFSPDGKQIAFINVSPNFNYETDFLYDTEKGFYTNIFVMDADGKNVRQLTNSTSCLIDTSNWSPDGKQIVFYRSCEDSEPEIFVINADGDNLTATNQNGSNPVWTTSGRQIAFTSDRYGESEIFLMDPDGSNVISTTVKGAVQDYWP